MIVTCLSKIERWLTAQFNEIIEEYATNPSYSVLAKIPYGLYQVSGLQLNDRFAPRFRKNQSNIYPRTDIKSMIEHGYGFRFTPLCMIWNPEDTKRFFTPFISDLCDAKQKGFKFAKPLLNMLWGNLIRNTCKKRHFEPGSVVDDDLDVFNIVYKDGTVYADVKKSCLTHFQFAPYISIFVLAHGI